MTDEFLNKKEVVELKVLTPLHIGAGSEKDWMKGADFVEDGGKIYVLNHKKLLQKISIEELSGVLVRKDDEGLKRKISGNLQEVSDLVFTKPASTDNDIKTFIKNGLTNKPIVPGSSVKGAIRSILLKELLNGSKPDRLDEEQYFGSPTDGDEFMRFIKISDAQFYNTELVNTKIFNLYGDNPPYKGGWKHSGGKHGKTTNEFKTFGFNTIYEVIKPGEKGQLSIALSGKAFDNLLKYFEKKKIKLTYNEIDEVQTILTDGYNKLFAIINKHTKEYIRKQIAFFEKYTTDKSNKIVESLENIKNQIPDNNSYCILKMSAGSGFHSITGDWRFDEYLVDTVIDKKNKKGYVTGHIAKFKGRKTAKSRKIAIDGDDFYLMGFVKLTVLTEDEIKRREQERLERIEAERKAVAEKLAREKAERERLEAEKRAKEEAARKAEYERLAKEKAEQEERERIAREKEEEERRRRETNKQKLEKGLVYLEEITNYNSGKNHISKIKKKEGKIPESQYNYIKTFVKRFFSKNDKEWNNFKRGKRWKEIKGWVGMEIARQWYDGWMK